MIEEGLFSRFLKPLLQKKNEKEAVLGVLNTYLHKDCDFEIQGLVVKIKNLSQVHKRELFLQKEYIETELEQKCSKKYTISF